MANDLREELLLAEFAEAWSHYRHIESTRQKYLTLFFGFLAGISGLITTLASKVDIKNILSVAGLASLLWTFSVFSGLLFANTRKMGRVLRGYENTMKEVREIAYGEQYESYISRLSVRSTGDPVMRMNIYRLQVVSEVVFAASALFFAGTLIFLTVLTWVTADALVKAAFIFGALTASGLILYILIAPELLSKKD